MTKLDRIILNFPLIQKLAHGSKQISLPGFQKLPLYDVVVFFTRQIRKLGLGDRAAAISFNFLLAIPATTIFLCTLIPYLPVSKQLTRELLIITKDLTPDRNTYILVKNFLVDFLNTPRSGLLSLGFILAIYYASKAMLGIMYTFNKSLIYSNKRNFFQTRWIAIKLTVLMVILIIATMLLMFTQGVVLNWMLEWLKVKGHTIKFLIKTLRWVFIIAMYYFSIAFIYKYAPSVHKRWRLRSPGTLLATFLTVLTTILFSYWVNNFASYNKVYGSIGTIMILMIVVYSNSLVLLIGYELNVSIHHLIHQADERAKHETDGIPVK